MRASKTFDRDVRELARKAANGYCVGEGCQNKGVEFHHRVPNTLSNNRNYPHLLHSIFNCAFVCRDCHANRTYQFRIAPSMALAYELYLKGVLGDKKTD